MRGIVKKLVSTFAAAALALAVVTVPRSAGSVAEAETSGNCTGNHSGMTEWTGGALTSGSYYLNGNVTISEEYKIDAPNNITLCLNGKTVTQTGNARIFQIRGGSLTLCDCSNGQGKLTGGKPTDTDLYGYGGAVYANNSIGSGFTMYGGTISGNTASQGGGVYVNCAVTINGGKITNNTASGSGGGVYVSNSSTFTMNGGTISGNTAESKDGGGVCLSSSGKFTMNGGTISGNTAKYRGGGVYVPLRCEFTMSGGTIEKNKADFNGGGVYVGGSNVYDGTFKMNGGTISGNETTADGGGVFVDTGGAFTMSSGTISGNKARTDGGGVFFYEGKFTIDGKVDISGNTNNGNSSANNVYLNKNRTITIGNGFDTSSTIGVYTKTTPTCASPVTVASSASDISSSFTADIAGQSIDFKDGQVQLSGAHNWGEWQTTTEPTATEKGEETRTCKNDGTHTETRELAALGGNTGDNSSGSGSSGGSSSSSSSGSGSSSRSSTDELTGDSQKESGNPATGTTAAIPPTALIAAAAMLITSKKRRKF